MRQTAIERCWIAGVPVDLIGEMGILQLFEQTVITGNSIVLANVNLHGIYCALRYPAMLSLLMRQDAVVHIDGTPVVWLLKALGCSLPANSRNGHIDLIPKMLEICAKRNWRVVVVGSDHTGAATNERVMNQLFPNLKIKAFDGYFDIEDVSSQSRQSHLLRSISEYRPNLMLVGMGMPRQEIWINSIKDLIDVPVIMPVGGFTDYFTGRAKMPPRFLGPLGLEWLFRLLSEPRRLAHRYLVEPFIMLHLMARATQAGARWGTTAETSEFGS